MEKLRDKMLKVIKETTFEVDERLAEACARVAEEEIANVIEENKKLKALITHPDMYEMANMYFDSGGNGREFFASEIQQVIQKEKTSTSNH